ncbi:MAG: 50S ribosomal protein L18 [archaeon]
MVSHKIYRVKFRRKRLGKTNYKKRLSLLQSRKPRLVIRRTNTQIIAQIIKYDADGDKIVIGFDSKQLTKLGWKHSTKNIPAAYLAGLAIGKKAQDKGVKEAILDLGLQTPIAGSKLYAALKGAVDSGLKIPCSEEIFPKQERLEGKHIQKGDVSKDLEMLKKKILG